MFDTSEFKLERIFEQNLFRSNDRRHYYPEDIKIQNTEQLLLGKIFHIQIQKLKYLKRMKKFLAKSYTKLGDR